MQNIEDLLEHNSDLSAKLMQIGDSIVYKLVQWTKRLPFYLELPVEVSPNDQTIVIIIVIGPQPMGGDGERCCFRRLALV